MPIRLPPLLMRLVCGRSLLGGALALGLSVFGASAFAQALPSDFSSIEDHILGVLELDRVPVRPLRSKSAP